MIDTRTIEDDRLIERYVRSFCGFGSPEAPFWLLTAEPLDERTALELRIAARAELEQPQFVDAGRYEDALAQLFALPLQRSDRRNAHEASRLGALRSRSAFLSTFANKRSALLQTQIATRSAIGPDGRERLRRLLEAACGRSPTNRGDSITPAPPWQSRYALCPDRAA